MMRVIQFHTTDLEKETNQTNTKRLGADDILSGRILLENLPEPYVLIATVMYLTS